VGTSSKECSPPTSTDTAVCVHARARYPTRQEGVIIRQALPDGTEGADVAGAAVRRRRRGRPRVGPAAFCPRQGGVVPPQAGLQLRHLLLHALLEGAARRRRRRWLRRRGRLGGLLLVVLLLLPVCLAVCAAVPSPQRLPLLRRQILFGTLQLMRRFGGRLRDACTESNSLQICP